MPKLRQPMWNFCRKQTKQIMRKLTSTRHETPELPIKRHLNVDIWLSLERSRAVQGFDLSQDFSEGRPFQGILGPTGLAPHHFWECLSRQSISFHTISSYFIHCLKDNFHLRTLAFWKKTPAFIKEINSTGQSGGTASMSGRMPATVYFPTSAGSWKRHSAGVTRTTRMTCGKSMISKV